MKKASLSVLVFITAAVALFAFNNKDNNDRYFQIVKNLDIFATLFKEVNSYYVDDINPNQLVKVGIDAMLNSLDPYTTYIPEDDIEDYMTMTTGEYGGIGALVDRKNGVNTVVMPYENSPADRAGLKIGDQILEINGTDLSDKDSEGISNLLNGASRSEIELVVKRFNSPDPFKVTLKRERITINNVPYYGFVNTEIGYVRLSDFTTKAGREVGNAVKELKSRGAKKIILDLRGNPGGLLNEAINVSNVFVEKGREVVSTKGKLDSWTKVYRTQIEPVDLEIPLAVLTDNGSASASEIVAGVMQDYDRGVLVGRKTFGKGLVQQTRPLAYNSQLKVTTAKYYIPSGRCIQAIDYSTRNPDGSVGKIADSLKSEFVTGKGRIVFDGGGLEPDQTVGRTQYAPITYALLRNDLLFHYATEYYYTQDSIGSPIDFRLSDQDYKNFMSWVSDKSYPYTTSVERKVEDLVKASKEDKYYEEIKDQIESLKKATLSNKSGDLVTFQKEIRVLLEQEIASRYTLQDGAIESTFQKDLDVLAAVEILNDTDRYRSILKQQ